MTKFETATYKPETETTLSPKAIEVRFLRPFPCKLSIYSFHSLFFFCRVPCFSSFLVFSQVLLSTNQKRQVVNKNIVKNYRKIPKISPGAYISQRPFLRGLFLEVLTFGAA